MLEKDYSRLLGNLYNGYNAYLQVLRGRKRVLEEALDKRAKGSHSTPTTRAVVIIFEDKIFDYDEEINLVQMSMRSIERILTNSGNVVAEIFIKKYLELIATRYSSDPDDIGNDYMLMKQIVDSEDRLAEAGFPILGGYKIFEMYNADEEEEEESGEKQA